MTLAPLLYRASPVDFRRSVSAPHSRHDLEKYSNPISFESGAPSPLSAPAVSATEISRPSSTSTQASNVAIVQQQQQYNHQNIHSPPNSSTSFSLPGLSALTSISSAPASQLRYVAQDWGENVPVFHPVGPSRVFPFHTSLRLTFLPIITGRFPIMQHPVLITRMLLLLPLLLLAMLR